MNMACVGMPCYQSITYMITFIPVNCWNSCNNTPIKTLYIKQVNKLLVHNYYYTLTHMPKLPKYQFIICIYKL